MVYQRSLFCKLPLEVTMSFRRTWDKEFFAQKAKDRAEGVNNNGSSNDRNFSLSSVKEEFRAADSGAAGPIGSERAFLKARDEKIDLESKVGKMEVINPTEDASRAGFWCEVCSCLLKDSAAYLSHINGKKHQRALGFSMRVERAGVDDVKLKLMELKQRMNAKPTVNRISALEEQEKRIQDQQEQKETFKRKFKEEQETKKRLKIFDEGEVEDGELEVEKVDPDFAAIMGFGGFRSSKKK